MKKLINKLNYNSLKHCISIAVFILISVLYFNPILKGKTIFQNDIKQYIGMSKEQKDFKKTFGEETYWTNSAFGGMPTYQLGARYPHNYIKKLDSCLRFLPRPADYLFLYFIGFYILLLTLKVDFRLSILGAIAFGFSTYYIIILGVGHNAKAHAIAYMPLVLSGILMLFNKRYLLGFIVTVIGGGLELVANHFQMSYYLFLLILVLITTYLIKAIKEKTIKSFSLSLLILFVAGVFSIGLNTTNILATKEYTDFSTRGGNDISINSKGESVVSNSGLDKSYITEYSYGILETLNLVFPRFLGGGSYEDVGKDSNSYKFLISRGLSPSQAISQVKYTPTYWGDQPIVEAPAYIGASLVFLFIFSLFIYKGKNKYWIVGGIVLSILLSWGKNLPVVTDFFINYIPLYNKFRAVSSIQVLVEMCIPILAILGLNTLLKKDFSKETILKDLYRTIGITAGISLVFYLFNSALFSFSGLKDIYFIKNYGVEYMSAIKKDRVAIFKSDILRSIIIFLMIGGSVYLFIQKKISKNILIGLIAFVILFDLVGVNLRYVNSEDFVTKREMQFPFQKNEIDKEILKDQSDYRVVDLVNSGARAPYFYPALGGYHAAKLRSYQNVNDFYLSKNNFNVLNMLNAKYLIFPDDNGKPQIYNNDSYNGSSWFVKEIKQLPSTNDEILSLEKLDNKHVAVFSNSDLKSSNYERDASTKINLSEKKSNYLKYTSENNNDGFAVFSEIFYPNGWNAFVDGNKVEIHKVDYLLRGLELPKGIHTIEFKFSPEVVKKGSILSLIFTIIFILGTTITGLYLNKKGNFAK